MSYVQRTCRGLSVSDACRTRALEARERALAAQQLRDERQLGTVRTPRERGADRLVQLATLDAQTCEPRYPLCSLVVNGTRLSVNLGPS